MTEAEFLTIAEKLKPHVERRMKMEPFPWLRDYYVDMNKLYTELTLEKIENELLIVRRGRLKDYKGMFGSYGRDKILIKADPGMGENHPREESGVGLVKGSIEDIFGRFLCFSKICTAR